MRSVFAGRDGLPILAAGTYITTDESPMRERWGGWYVTGTCGRQRHMGDQTVKDAEAAASLDLDRGANVTDLRRFCDTSRYLSGQSDIVALMVIEHQTHLHNLIARASYETRRALHYEEALSKDLHRAPDLQSESVRSRIK